MCWLVHRTDRRNFTRNRVGVGSRFEESMALLAHGLSERSVKLLWSIPGPQDVLQNTRRAASQP